MRASEGLKGKVKKEKYGDEGDDNTDKRDKKNFGRRLRMKKIRAIKNSTAGELSCSLLCESFPQGVVDGIQQSLIEAYKQVTAIVDGQHNTKVDGKCTAAACEMLENIIGFLDFPQTISDKAKISQKVGYLFRLPLFYVC